MLKFKKIVATGCAALLTACLGAALCACGSSEGVAATWANGEVSEDSVTNYIENMRSLYGYSSDQSGWETFLKNRTYDTAETSDISDLADKEKKDDEKKADGTVQDYRAYVIEQIVRNDVAEWEAGQRNLEVTDEELDAAVESNKQAIEAQYMAGTFESILQMQGYKDLESYKEGLKTELQVNKLQKEIVGKSSSEEGWDQSKWDKFIDGLMAYADLKINDMPSGLSYDPATTAATQDSSAGEGTEAEDGSAQSDESKDADNSGDSK